jgi:two-component system cell cycle sensor histidine kinase/response regulator CckA
MSDRTPKSSQAAPPREHDVDVPPLADLLPPDLSHPLTISTLAALLDEEGRIVGWPSPIALWTGLTEAVALGRTLTGAGLGIVAGRTGLEALLAEARRLGISTCRTWLETHDGVVIDAVLEIRALRGPGQRPGFEALILVPELAPSLGTSAHPEGESDPGQQGWLEALFQFSRDAVLLTDLDGTILAINPAGLRMMGHLDAAADESGTGWRAVQLACSPDLREMFRNRLTTGANTEVLLTRQDGSSFPAWMTVRILRDRMGHEHAAMIVRDLTEHRRMEHALRLSDERFRVALLHAPVVAGMLDRHLRIIWFYGPHAYLTPEQAMGKRMSELEVLVNGTEVDVACAEVMETGKGRQIEGHLRAPGVERVYDITLEPLRDQDGAVQGVTFAALDVSERVRTGRALYDSEQRFRNAFEDSGAGMALVTLAGQVMRVNAAMTHILGYSEAELLQMNVRDLCLPADRAHSENLLRHVLAETGPQHATLRKVRKDGALVVAQLTRSLVRTDAGQPAYIIDQVLDITHEEVLRERVRQSQKLEAVGRLAGGVAHDFNNMLTAIRGGCELMRMALQGDPRLVDLELIETAADRAARLTAELLAFGGRQLQHVARHDVSDLVRKFEPLLRQAAVPSSRLVLDLDARAGAVEVDANHMEQALVNLVLNARDAMQDGGVITLQTRHEVLTPEVAATLQLPVAEYVRISVYDAGCGMDDQVRMRLFEPFFTTKPKGKGLAMVYGFAKQSHGQVSVDSAPDQGSTFHLWLPIASGASRERAEPETASAGPLNTGTVLIVDDEPGVRDTISRLLVHSGFRVLAASSGEEALALLKQHPEVDALLTDLVMPRMDGRTLVTEARRLRPGLAVALMSGYTDDRDSLDVIHSSGVAFLHKPFRSEALFALVSDLMQGRGAASSVST